MAPLSIWGHLTTIFWLAIDVLTDTNDEPDTSAIYEAYLSSHPIVFDLEDWREEIEQEFPEQTDALAAIDKVLEVLRQEHGGFLPDVFFARWLKSREDGLRNDRPSYPYTQQQRRIVVATLKRWEGFRRSFEGMPRCRLDIFEQDVVEMMRFLHGWLGKYYRRSTRWASGESLDR